MKDLKIRVREALITKGINEGKLKNFVSMEKWWERSHPDLCKPLFDEYRRCNEIYPIKVKDFILSFVFGVDNFVCYDIKDVILKRQPETSNAILNVDRYGEGLKDRVRRSKRACDEVIGFETDSVQEAVYCFNGGIKIRPVCELCGGRVKFAGPSAGFRSFCSAKCQNITHNSQKPIRLSHESDDEIRDALNEIPIDNRNLFSEEVASRFENILNYTNKISKNIPVKESLFIFMNRLTKEDVMCPVCEVRKRKFISQGQGYLKTCGCKSCVYGIRTGEFYPGTQSVGRGYYSIRGDSNYAETGFLYIMKSEDLNLFKIGVSQDPVTRMRCISKDIGDLVIHNCFFIKTGLVRLENELHNRFSNKRSPLDSRIAGYTEWFKLSDSDVVEIEEFLYGISGKF